MDTWSAVGPTEMVRPMYDDCMNNVFNKYLEDICKSQLDEIAELKSRDKQMVQMWKELQDKDSVIRDLKDKLKERENLIEKLITLVPKHSQALVEIDELKTTIMALEIQAAESEHRADEEKRQRIVMVMRR